MISAASRRAREASSRPAPAIASSMRRVASTWAAITASSLHGAPGLR
jgi:hypothetical protein